jgi:hypothetical protein
VIGTRAEAEAWIRAHATLTGRVEDFRIREWSTVLRAPTARGPVWFKANPPSVAFEPALVDALARWAPAHVRTPIAVDPARGWLLAHDGGPSISDTGGGIARWERMMTGYAELQRAVAGRTAEMLALGVPDCRPEVVPDAARMVGVAHPELAGWCAELAADGIGLSIQHEDLSGSNVFDADNRVFDWGDATVSHPFASLLAALYVGIHALGVRPGAPELARIRDAYLEPWTGEHDRATLRRSATLAVRMGKVTRALAWHRVQPDSEFVQGWVDELATPDVI